MASLISQGFTFFLILGLFSLYHHDFLSFMTVICNSQQIVVDALLALHSLMIGTKLDLEPHLGTLLAAVKV